MTGTHRANQGRTSGQRVTEPVNLRAGQREYGIDTVREKALHERLAAGHVRCAQRFAAAGRRLAIGFAFSFIELHGGS